MKAEYHFKNPFTINLPTIDLHGYDSRTAVFKVNEFIEDNIKLRNKEIVVVHGIGEGVLRRAIHEELLKNNHVMSHELDYYNVGSTIIKLHSQKK